MVNSGTEIFNPRTGQRTIFLQTAADTGGELLRTETFHPAHGPAEPEHVHPFQHSRCQVMTGSLRFNIAGVERSVNAGETVDIPPNVPHYFWNDNDDEAHAVQEFRPALTTEKFFETYFALAQSGQLNDKGIPSNPFHMAVLLQEYDRVIRVMQPPRFLQLLLMSLAPLGRLMGYRGNYS